MGKIKIENFHVFEMQWLCRAAGYAIVKVDLIELSDITKRHDLVITVWLTSAIEVTALSKTHIQK